MQSPTLSVSLSARGSMRGGGHMPLKLAQQCSPTESSFDDARGATHAGVFSAAARGSPLVPEGVATFAPNGGNRWIQEIKQQEHHRPLHGDAAASPSPSPCVTSDVVFELDVTWIRSPCTQRSGNLDGRVR